MRGLDALESIDHVVVFVVVAPEAVFFLVAARAACGALVFGGHVFGASRGLALEGHLAVSNLFLEDEVVFAEHAAEGLGGQA